MRMLIVLGDKHSGGGSVINGSPHTDIDGKPIARVGDKAVCPRHKGIFPIITGDNTLIIDGQAVARHGDKFACGCSLISGQQNHAWVEAGGSGSSPGGIVPSTVMDAAPVLQSLLQKQNPASSEKSEVCEECLLAAAKTAAAFLGR